MQVGIISYNLICRGHLEGATSCHACRWCATLSLYIFVLLLWIFQPYKVVIRYILLHNCWTVGFFFLVNFLKTWLHNVILVRCGHFCLVNYSAPFGHPLVGWNFRLLHHVTFLLLCVYQLPQICYQVLVQSNLWYLWVLEAVSIFWFSGVWHCLLIGGYHYFGGTYYIHFHIDSSLITQKTSIFSAWKLHILWSVLFLIL